MNIKISKKIPTVLSLDPKVKPTYKTIFENIKIPDKIVDKTIAVIDELLDRTYDDLEERSWTGVEFPLIPFPFFQKYRLPENVGIDDYWIGPWLSTDLQNIIIERSNIIDILMSLGGMEEIKHHPAINLSSGIFDGDRFDLIIDISKLISLKKMILKKQQEVKEKKQVKKQKWYKFSPEWHGMGIDFEVLFQKLKGKLRKKN